MTRMQHEQFKGRWVAGLAPEVAGDTAGEGTHTRRTGAAAHPGMAAGRAQLGAAGRRWRSCWTPPVSGRPVAAVGIPTSSAGYGQNGGAGSCACCCRASRRTSAGTKCHDSRAARARRRCFTKWAHGTTWAPGAAGKATLDRLPCPMPAVVPVLPCSEVSNSLTPRTLEIVR